MDNTKTEVDKRYISEIITRNEIERWQYGDIIKINAGVGKGKSYFVLNTLYDFCRENNKKILVLTNRSNLKSQYNILSNENESKNPTIKIINYQELEHRLYSRDTDSNFEFFITFNYDYIVCDEYHYWSVDSMFNRNTDMSMHYILNNLNAVKILMSATPLGIDKYIKEHMNLDFAYTYKTFHTYDTLKNIYHYSLDDTIVQHINDIVNTTNDKIIFFSQSAKFAYELYLSIGKEKAVFNCSQNNKKYYKHVNEDEISKMLEEETFDKRILITTAVLDNGVNFKDRNIKHIIISMWDTTITSQCIGRKRIIDDEDTYDLYIHEFSNKVVGGKKRVIQSKLNSVDVLEINGVVDYIRSMRRYSDNSGLIYDDIVDGTPTKIINQVMRYKLQEELEFCDFLLHKINNKRAYITYIHLLLLLKGELIDMEEIEKENKLEMYLRDNVGKVFPFKKDREEIISIINVRDGDNNRLLKNIKTLNAKLEEKNLDYIIRQFDTYIVKEGKKVRCRQAWKISKIIDN